MIRVSGALGEVTLEQRDEVLLFTACGEPPMDAVVAVYQTAYQRGWLHEQSRSLVDLLHFTGSVDWSAVRSIGTFVPWALKAGRSNRSAFVIRNSAFAMVIKVCANLFPGADHRVFSTREQALAWLHEDGVPTSENSG